MLQPDWSIPDLQKGAHEDALRFMKEHGPIVTNSDNVALLCLKNAYAHTFVNQMKTQLVANAILAGFQPVWVIKNCLLQKAKSFGINGYQFSSLDKNPKSFIHLVGFCSGNAKDNNLRIIVLKNNEDEFLTINNSY